MPMYVLLEIPEATMPRTRRPYPPDLTDQEWNLLQPLLASPRGVA
jgi:hypothetical protein